jgi:3-oxoacyl-[acyl-carrier-protein] synthase-1
MKTVSILASGMVTCVGLDAPSSCAAIRCGIDNFTETRFMDQGGEWIIGAQVPLEQPWRGLPRLVHMVAPAIKECLAHIGSVRTDDIPLLLCVAEKERPGRIEGLDQELFAEIQTELGVRFHHRSSVIAKGRVGGAIALGAARELLEKERVPFCIVAGVDSYLVTGTLAAFEEKLRLLTSQNSNGFVPGEAGAAVLIGAEARSGALACLGIGTGQEKATVESEEPLRGDGLLGSFKAALEEAGTKINDLDYRITDANGEQYWFKEATLALDRILRNRQDLFEIWHPADCIGETGAAVVPSVLSIALRAMKKGYAFGRGPLCHFSSDGTERTALVLGTKT